MNSTERDQLQQFLSALRQTRADPKDQVADELIREAVASQADAPYLLVQRAMALGLALEGVQARVQQLETQCADLQTRLQAAQSSTQTSTQRNQQTPTSFLGSGAQAWGRTPEPVQRPLATHAVAPQAGASSWGGGLMAQVATTAAGVVAGGLLFQGIQSLMGHNTPPPAAPSPLSNAQPDTLAPPEAHTAASGDEASFGPLADAGDSGDVSWDAGEDWA